MQGYISSIRKDISNILTTMKRGQRGFKEEDEKEMLTGIHMSCHDLESSSFTNGAAGAGVGAGAGDCSSDEADGFEFSPCPSDPNNAGGIAGSLQAFVTRFICADRESESV